MTSPTPTVTPPLPPTPIVRPTPESRLDQLAARYDAAKQKAKAAELELTEITDGIKAELSRLHPVHPEVVLTSPFLEAPLQLSRVTSVRFDSKGCKASHPEVYAAFAKWTTSVRLTPVRS